MPRKMQIISTTFYYPWKEKIKVVKWYSCESKSEPSKLYEEHPQNIKKDNPIENGFKILVGTPQ